MENIPETFLTRAQAAALLTELGYPTRTTTLATKVTRGGGPVFRVFGNRALYRASDLVAWAQSRLSAPRVSSSQIAA